MRLVFIDDSQQTDPLRRDLGPLVALGGVVIRDDQIAAYATALSAIRAEFGIPDGEEIKWKPPKRSYLASAGKEIVTNLRSCMLEAALDHDISSIVVMIDHGARYTSRTAVEVGKRTPQVAIRTPDDPSLQGPRHRRDDRRQTWRRAR